MAVVPFHMWTPDVYQGAPTSVTAFMAVASKAASFGAFLRVFVEGLGAASADWSVLFTVHLPGDPRVGQPRGDRPDQHQTHAGLFQHRPCRVCPDRSRGGRRPQRRRASLGFASVLLYIAIYSFMTLGAFALIGMLRKEGQESEKIEDYAGLAKREPFAAFFMLVFMVSLAGIPPTAGFIGKFYIFMAAVNGGHDMAGRRAVIFAAISAFYYLRVVMVMYMREPNPCHPFTTGNLSGPVIGSGLRPRRRGASGSVPQCTGLIVHNRCFS